MASSVEYRLHRGNTTQPYWWTVISTGNWKTLAKSENYVNRADAISAANLVRQHSGGADFTDHTGES
jgi:uncharacterized protein YegP (UPF0339 family)